jgi:tetratricopeptide (TPR) repeat protein
VESLHAKAVAAAAAARPAVAANYLRAALRLLGWPDRPQPSPWTARLLITLAHAEAEQGRTDYGFTLLDQAETFVDRADLGTLLQQRGLLELRRGRIDAARRMLDAAIPALTDAGDPVVLARTLLNRGVLHLAAGRVRLARGDLERCGHLAAQQHLDLIAAKVTHNLGCCELASGDIPAALHSFAVAADSLRSLQATGLLTISALERARALQAAGLADEAGRELDGAIELFRQQRLSQDQAEAELARAQSALATGDLPSARGWSERARRRFRRRGNQTWAALAALTQLQVDFAAGRRPLALARRADLIAAQLRSLGLRHDAETATLLGLRALLAAGDLSAAVDRWTAAERTQAAAPVEIKLLRRLTRAELDRAHGRNGAALTQLRRGLAELQDHRGRFGSVDLQSSATALGADLAATGLDIAWQRGEPRLMFGWSERSRAQAFRIKPVRPPADPHLVEALAELRQLRRSAREAELAKRSEPEVRARCTELERLIRQHGWEATGTGEFRVEAAYPGVRDELIATGRAMVSFLVHRGGLHALVLADGSITRMELGSYAVVSELARRLLGDLNALTSARMPAALRTVVADSARRNAETLNIELIAPLRGRLVDRELVIVPTGSLTVIPWGLLPDLAGCPVTVVPSASVWLAVRAAASAARLRPAPEPVLVAGPDLDHADAEIAGLAELYPRRRLLRGAEATTAATLPLMDGASVVHIAAHGQHDEQNVLFSRLYLVDGPLMAYDLQLLEAPPAHVVLSACDVGRAVVRAGDEILGMTAALLYLGTPNVVASVCRVPDSTAATVMRQYHRGLTGGDRPARALAGVTEPSPFVCFGAG